MARLVTKSRIGRLGLCAVAAASMLGGLAVSTPALGQGRMAMTIGGAMGAKEQLDASSIEEYAAILKFDEQQKTAAMALFQAYEADFNAASKTRDDDMKKVRDEFADSQDPGIWQREMPKLFEKYGKRTAELDTQLMNDLRSLMTEQQQAVWPQVERAHRRRQSLPNGMLSGESMDLVRLVNGLKLEQVPEPVQQSLERYASELDSALESRDKVRRDLGEKLNSSMRPGGGMMNFDIEGMQKTMGEMRRVGIPVRDINDRFASVLQGALPEDKRDAFEDSVRKAKFPQIYGEPHLVKAAAAAEKFDDITPEQKSTITAIREAYLREVESANQAWAAEQAKAEADGGGDEMMQNWGRMMQSGDGPEQTPLAKARAARRKLDRETLEKLKAALTEEQIERLPERDDAFGGMRFGMPRRGNR